MVYSIASGWSVVGGHANLIRQKKKMNLKVMSRSFHQSSVVKLRSLRTKCLECNLKRYVGGRAYQDKRMTLKVIIFVGAKCRSLKNEFGKQNCKHCMG